MKVDWNKEKEKIETLISEGVPYERIGRMYGVCGATIKKSAKKIGISVPQRRSINENEHFNKGTGKTHKCIYCGKEFKHKSSSTNTFCDNHCQNEYEYIKYIEMWKNGEVDGVSGKSDVSKYIRRYLFEKHNNKCEKCGWGVENPMTNKIPLQIHHIDGNCLNNNEENLELLCPNCHSLTENFGRLNSASKRKRKKKYDSFGQ